MRRTMLAAGAVAVALGSAALVAACSGGSPSNVSRAERSNMALLSRSHVLLSTDRLLFRRTMSYRAGEGDSAPVGGYLTRVEIALPGPRSSPADVQSQLESRALAGGFRTSVSAREGGVQPSCYRGFGVQLCVLVAGLDDADASAELSVDTHPTG